MVRTTAPSPTTAAWHAVITKNYDRCDCSGVAELERLARTITRWDTDPALAPHPAHERSDRRHQPGHQDIKGLGFGCRNLNNCRLGLLLRCVASWTAMAPAKSG